MNEKSRTPKWRRAGKLSYLYLAIFAGLSAFPFYWMFIVASNGNEEISKIPPSLVPGARFLKVMHDVYSVVPFNRALFNTFVVGVVVATAQVFFSALAGFAFAKLRFRGKRFSAIRVRERRSSSTPVVASSRPLPRKPSGWAPRCCR